MSEKIGPITFGKREEMVFLGKEIATEKDYSEKTATEIDTEVTRLINDAHKNAKKIITDKRHLLDKLAKQLIDKETIEKEEFEELMKETEITSSNKTEVANTRPKTQRKNKETLS